jgi:hypothetical protein
MKKIDYRKVLVNGKEYECECDKNGQIYLYYNNNGNEEMLTFDNTEHEGYLSKGSRFQTPDNISIEVININFVFFQTGDTNFTGKIIFED